MWFVISGRRHGSVGRALACCARGARFNPQCGHIGLRIPKQHPCILQRELRTVEPIYVPCQMWVVCFNPAWSYRRETLSSEVPCIWCSMQGQVKDTTQGVNVWPAVDSQPWLCSPPIWGELLRQLSMHTRQDIYKDEKYETNRAQSLWHMHSHGYLDWR